MHTYARRSPKGELARPPSIDSTPFRGALDVVARAEVDPVIGWATWPEVWHLDESGTFQCYFKASSLCSVRQWADDPSPLHRSRCAGVLDGGCADWWLIVDSRPAWLHDPPDEGDAAALLEVRTSLAGLGVSLLDCLVFDDHQHWWSLHELTSSSIEWDWAPARGPSPSPHGTSVC